MIPSVWAVLFWLWAGSEIVISVARRTRSKDVNKQDRGSQAILWMVIAPSLLVCEWLRHVAGRAWRVELVSLMLLVVGLVIRGAAIASLGTSFSANVATEVVRKVRTAGMYGVVRHPSYVGLLFVFVAVGVHSRSWVGLGVAVVPTTLAVLYRIRVEEAALVAAFGAEYVGYMGRTWRLIPGVY